MKNTDKKSLLLKTYITSLLSLMLCVTMLVGTTYAWFTSNVTTAGNEIQVGTLMVDLTDTAGNSLGNKGGLFGSGSVKWEPGATQIETVKVVNKGDLAFDYGVYLSTVGTAQEDMEALALVGKYIDVYITTNNATATNAQQLKDNWIRVGTLADVARNGYMLANGSWTPAQGTENPILDTVKIALHMPAEVSDEKIMGKKIGNLGIKLMATQKVSETDAFGTGYDEAAPVDVLVGTYEEFAAAVVAGQSLRLTADITVPENVTLTIASGKSVVIDMNGHNITATSAGKTGNKELFLVKGNLTVKGVRNGNTYTGAITYTHKDGENMSWNAMSTVFDITAGGVVTLADVKVVNAGGTDMNFVAHLNNWGKAALYMDGAYLEAPYCAVRVFNSGYDMNDVVARGTTLKSDNMALWVHNYTAADFGASYDKAKIDARLNISIWDSTNTLKGKIRYGFTNADVITTVSTAEQLQKALDAASGTTSITLDADITGNVTAVQKPGVKVIINGANKKFNGVLTVDGKSTRLEDTALTIENVIFTGAGVTDDHIISLGKEGDNDTRYTDNVTVKNCTFTGTGLVAVQSHVGGDWNLTLDGCTVNAGMHSLLQVKNVEKGLKIVNCTVNSKNGVNLNNTVSLEMSDCNFNVQGYAVRFGEGSAANDNVETYLIKNCALKSACAETDDAVIIFRGTADKANLTLENTTLEGTTTIINNVNATVVTK